MAASQNPIIRLELEAIEFLNHNGLASKSALSMRSSNDGNVHSSDGGSPSQLIYPVEIKRAQIIKSKSFIEDHGETAVDLLLKTRRDPKYRSLFLINKQGKILR